MPETKYIVSDETIERTQRCNKDFSCLKGQRDDLCLVDSCVNGEVHFIKCLNEEHCSYQGPFGNNFICYCPTRKEIYNKNGV